MDTVIQNVRFAMRLLLKNRGFTAVAVLTLAVSISANTAIFSLVHAVLLRPLPYPDPNQLVWIWSNRTDRDKTAFCLPDVLDYQDQNRSFNRISAFTGWSANLVNAGEPERIFGVRSSADIFKTLGVRAQIGRTLGPQDDDPANPRVVVLSNGFWKRRFGSNSNIVGKPLTLDNENYIVVGVLPPDFSFPQMEADVVVPLIPKSDPLRRERASISFLFMIGRMKERISLVQAESDLDGIAVRLQRLYPVANAAKKGVKLVPLQEQRVGDLRPAFLILCAAAAVVLLIACANLANLMLARASTRYREMAVRLALGATQRSLIKQLLTEMILLALIGGLMGLALTQPLIRLIVTISPTSLPRMAEIGLDTTVVVFTFVIALVSGALFGLIPALHIAKQSLNEELKGSGKGTSAGSRKGGIRNALILSEVAMSLLLLIGAGLLAKSLARLESISPGFEMEKLLVTRLSLPKAQYSTPELLTSFYQQLSRRITNLPGVKSVGATSVLPLGGSNVRVNFVILGRPPVSVGEQPITQYRMITPNYFQTMKIPAIAGRDFKDTDTLHSQPVAIINETFARRYWPNASAIGAHIKLDDNNTEPREVQIIGVMGSVRHTSLNEDPAPEVYVPISQIPAENVSLVINNMNWVIRTSAEPMSIAAAIRREIQSANGNIATSNTKAMGQFLSSSLAQRKFNFFLLGVSAITALVLASMGIYGLISYSVAQRTQELGVRIALGAQQFDVLKLIIGGGLKVVISGLILGLIAAIASTRVLANLIFGISATDPSTFAAMSILLTLVALVASYVPARRATKVDPLIALRGE